MKSESESVLRAIEQRTR